MNKYMFIIPYINEKFNTFYANNVLKNRLMENDFLREIDYLYDDMIDYIYECFENSCIHYYPSYIIHKYIEKLSKTYNEIKSLYYGEKFNENESYCVTVTDETTYGVNAQKHIMNCDKQSAKSFKRRFDKLNGMFWNDYYQTGLYCSIVSRNYCINHFDFETDINPDILSYNI